MICRSCPSPIPTVSLRLAADIANKIPERHQMKVILPAVNWLLERHEGLSFYHGIHGRPYTNEEKVAIADDTTAIEWLTCPYCVRSEDIHIHKDGSCILESINPNIRIFRDSEFRDANGQGQFMWLPAALVRALDKDLLRELVSSKDIADAKVTILTRDEEFYSGRNLPVAVQG